MFLTGGAEPNDTNNVPSNAYENFEHTSQRGGVDSAGYSIPFMDNEGYTIPYSCGPKIPERGTDETLGVCETWPQNSASVIGNSALGDENVSKPQIKVSSQESEISPQGSGDDRSSNGALQSNSRSDDIVLVYVLPSSDQKLDERKQSEAGGAAKITVENSRFPPNDSVHKDFSSSDDIELVYIEPISDGPEPGTYSETNQGSAKTKAKFDDKSNISSEDHGRNTRSDITEDVVLQANGRRQHQDAADGEGNVPGYQALNQKERKIEEKSRYQKLIKRKVA